MTELNSPEVQTCMRALSKAERPSDAVMAWALLQRKHPDLIGIVALSDYDRCWLPSTVRKYTSKPNGYLVPYFSGEKLYFLDDAGLTEMFDGKEERFQFDIDYSIMFDTNIATYINRVVHGEPLGGVQNKLIPLLDDLLRDNLNFDHLFYMVENVKIVHRQVLQNYTSRLYFWRSLSKGHRRNMVSLQVFRSIDCEAYKRTLSPKAKFSYREAAREAIEFSYNFYMSDGGKKSVLRFVLLQRIILLHLIGMIRIHLSSSKGVKKKMAEYFNFVNDVVGSYLDRESIIAHKYFVERSQVRLLESIKVGMNPVRLLKKLDNIAWDIAAPRFMERLIVDGGNGRYFIPMFMSFDSKMREVLSLYPVKGAVFNRKSGAFTPIAEVPTAEYFERNGCLDELARLHSEPARSKRILRPRLDRSAVHSLIKKEYGTLRRIVQRRQAGGGSA